MLISASIVITPRRSRRCDVCGEYIHSAHVRLYGSAERGDPPYVVRIHPECATRDVLVKLQAAAQHCVKPNADHASVIARVATAVNSFGGVGLR